MMPSDIHFLLREQHRGEMLAEAKRRRLIKLSPRQQGLRMVVVRLRLWMQRQEPRGARQEEAAPAPWGRVAIQWEEGSP